MKDHGLRLIDHLNVRNLREKDPCKRWELGRGKARGRGGGRCRIVNKGGCSHRSYYAPFEQPRRGISWSNFSVSFIEDNMVAMINNFHKFLMLTTFHLQKEICFLMWNNCYPNKHFLNCDIFGWYFNTKSVHQHPMKF